MNFKEILTKKEQDEIDCLYDNLVNLALEKEMLELIPESQNRKNRRKTQILEEKEGEFLG